MDMPQPNTRIVHRIFGIGTVTGNTHTGMPSIKINFDSHGEKSFVWSFACDKIQVLPNA